MKGGQSRERCIFINIIPTFVTRFRLQNALGYKTSFCYHFNAFRYAVTNCVGVTKAVLTLFSSIQFYTDRQKKRYNGFCQVRHVVHKYEMHNLNMTRTLSKASGLFEFIDFFYQACWLIYMNILPLSLILFLLSNVSRNLHVAYLLPFGKYLEPMHPTLTSF